MGELKVIKRDDCTSETTQTPGMDRVAGIALETAGSERLWMGYVTMKGGGKSGAHHHGHCGSGIYIIKGRARFRWGERLENIAEAGPGDFIYVPPHLIHQEINPSAEEPIEMIVARDCNEGIVVNVQAAGAE